MSRVKKQISVLLALIMLVSLFPVSAFAAAGPNDPVTDARDFVDISVEECDAVQFVLDKLLMEGIGWVSSKQNDPFPDGHRFDPKGEFTRAMIVTVLYRFVGKPAVDYSYIIYDDIPVDAWYRDAVAWATEYGIVEGYGNGKFGPGDNLERQQVFTIFHRFTQFFYPASKSEVKGSYIGGYTDGHLVADWALDATNWAIGPGVDIGYSNNEICPNEHVTRIQVAKMLQGLFIYLEDYDPVFGSSLRVYAYGSGSVNATIGNSTRTISSNTEKTIPIPGEALGNITMKANSNSFISYYKIDDNTPVYIGYGNLSSFEKQNQTLPLSSLTSAKVLRVYFITNGDDQQLVNPQERGKYYATGYGDYYYNYVDTYPISLVSNIYGTAMAQTMWEDHKPSNGSKDNFYMGGHCYGISSASALIAYPEGSGILAADFASNKSYTIPNNIKSADIGAQESGYLSLFDFVRYLQMTGMSDEYKKDTGGTGGDGLIFLKAPDRIGVWQNNQNHWNSFFSALDSYMDNHANPVIIHISGSTGSHAVFATGYEENDNQAIIYIKDPNGTSPSGSEQITVTKANGEYMSYSYKAGYDKIFYITYDRVLSIFNKLIVKNAPQSRAAQLAYISIDDGSLEGLTIENSNGEISTLSENDIFGELDASKSESVEATGDEDDFSSILIWLPADEYTITNTKTSNIKIILSDSLTSIETTLEPNDTTTIAVSNNSPSSTKISFESETGANAYVKLFCDETLNAGYSSLTIQGAITNDNASVVRSNTGVAVTGFNNVEIECVDSSKNVFTNSCDNISGQDFEIVGATGEITGNIDFEQSITATYATKLSTPQNANFTGGIATWDPVSNASSYSIQLYRSGSPVGMVIITENNYYDFSSYSLDGNTTYTYSVQALAMRESLFSDSEKANSTSYIIQEAATLSNPTNVSLYNGIGSWSAVENATSYELTLYCDGEIVSEGIISIETTYDFKKLPQRGTYFFTVRAVGDEHDYLGSSFIRSNNYLYSPLLSDADSFTITVEQSKGGVITPGSTDVSYGASVTFVIAPLPGYKVTDVLVDGVSVGHSHIYVFNNVIKNHTITAVYTKLNLFYTITVQQSSGGIIAPSTKTVITGDSQTFAIIPYLGYKVEDVLVDDVSVGKVNLYIFADVDSDHTITAVYSRR